jgi:carbon-monoxide dehydrogenase large subunit
MATRYAGARVHRVEDGRLLTGAGTFVDDIARPGMLHACFVRSPYARARIVGVDASDALALPGVHAVLVARDLNPDVHEQWYTLSGPDQPEEVAELAAFLASDRAQFITGAVIPVDGGSTASLP